MKIIPNQYWIIVIAVFLLPIIGCNQKSEDTIAEDYPDPVSNPKSPLMLSGDWFDHPHQIDFDNLPKIPSEHALVSDVTAEGVNHASFSDAQLSGGVNQHSYLTYFEGKYWVMWSDGPGVEDRVGQVVKYATSPDGLQWSEPDFLTTYPEGSEPESEHYNTRTEKGMRWISRGFWQREGELLALVSLDEAAGFFGPSLELLAYKWNGETNSWEKKGVVYKNAINNFPPKLLPSGEWLMSRRAFDYKESGIEFLVGGIKGFDQWESYPVTGSTEEMDPEEPYWWVLPDGKSLMALFRDNRKSGYLYRAFSIDNGRTWSNPLRTNFPDARSKFNGLRMSDGRYVLVSNPNPERRDPLALSISEDGMVFTKMGYLTGGRYIDYPHVIEQDGYLLIAFAGSVKQKIEVLKVKISDLDNLEMPPLKR